MLGLLGYPIVRCCQSGRVDVELRYLVVGAVVWPGVAVHPGRLAPPPSSFLFSLPARVLD
jgi:hypothetical protein